MASQNSETVFIKRSQIKLNPYNIKEHSDEQVMSQKKNIKKVGFFGGIVWNEFTGNLVDGHRRIAALDSINKYDGTEETDYEIKVEQVVLDEKTEKEQMAYMALANSKADYNLVAKFIDEVDYKNIGVTELEYQQILNLRNIEDELEDFGDMEMMEDVFAPKPRKEEKTSEENSVENNDSDVVFETPSVPQASKVEASKAPITELPSVEKTNEEFRQALDEKPKMTREEVREQKQHCADVNTKYMDKAEQYAVINFESQEQKITLCEMLGLTPKENMVINGSELIQILEEGL